ncbi:MAG: shikimate kinase [Candidatus Lokiarchaeota archaeon]|nr:shikimate kinase [Candidatus Lokiarchaeota archaeon]MBD3339527.1 shikimate kinase [Candidatus Lokiarchaeota archaeon]
MIKDSIALIGFMATGKTTIGKLLTKKLPNDYKFIETDNIIVETAGKTIPEIFAEDGEIRFREYEIEACKKASRYEKVIISCGGGVVLNKINIDYLKQRCYIVLLKTSAEEIYKRAMKDGKETRPVIDKKDPMKEINNVLDFREPFYNAAAEIVIDTTDKSLEDIVEEIIRITQLNNDPLSM